jgi:CRISPR-associated protein Csx14
MSTSEKKSDDELKGVEPMSPSDYVMIATLGGQAQVVTFALDALLARDEHIQEVIVVYLASYAESHRTRRALAQLSAEFADDVYAGRPCRLRPVPLRHQGQKLDDIRDETAANAAWSAVYTLIADLKSQGQCLHACISGGRRMLALLAMSAAMLHFDHNDRLWHMYTPLAFLERARDGAILHARPEDGVQLIPVPLAPWGAYFPALRSLTQASPLEAVVAQTQWLDRSEQMRCRAVVEALTSRQLDTLKAFAAGQNPQQVAETLCVTVKTVHAHKTVILAECRNAWGLPDGFRLDYYFLREKFGLYFQLPRRPALSPR